MPGWHGDGKRNPIFFYYLNLSPAFLTYNLVNAHALSEECTALTLQNFPLNSTISQSCF